MTLYIFLQGGLGNQLFQYAAGLVLQQTRDVRLIKALPAHSGRDYRATLYHRLGSVDSVELGIPLLQFDSFIPWKPDDYLQYDTVILQGYFQYLRAIQGVLPRLREDMGYLLWINREMMRAKYGITDSSSVGFLHVRRGDYLTAPPNLHWIMDIPYYLSALTKFTKKMRWIVLSDDVAWCRVQELFTEFAGIEIADESDELDGLALMSLCHGGAIIGNSTYSWWGAMLGAEPAGAPVVYPSKWFSYETPELFPSRWIRL